MSTEKRAEASVEDIQNIAEIVWFDTLYQGGQDVQFAALIHNFMFYYIDQHLPPEYNPAANIRITSGQFIEKSANWRLVLGFEYLEDEIPGLSVLKRTMSIDWNDKWSLEAQEIDSYRVVCITHQDQTASYFPSAIYLN